MGASKDTPLWIALSMVSGIGPVLFKRLISRFGTPEQIFKAPPASLKTIEGIGEKLASEIHTFRLWQKAEKEVAAVERFGAGIVTIADGEYPNNLLNIYDPPPFLYVKGVLTAGYDRYLAVVGSRFASPYGKVVTERLSRDLANNGFAVVSGMARGIDTAAHRGAMDAGGKTIAVLGSGIDVVYPPENRKLYEDICNKGAVISEYPMGTGPHSENFPARNRIISGMSLGAVIVEASVKSGSLITAACAAEQGREVFAVPGNISSNGSKGTNRLIKEGAKLVTGVEDILEEFEPPSACSGTEKAANLSGSEASIMAALAEPAHIDEIASVSGMDVRAASSLLLNMELNGLIRQLPGMMYIKNI